MKKTNPVKFDRLQLLIKHLGGIILGLFGNSEEKRAQKEREARQQIEQGKATIYNSPGKYYAQSFNILASGGVAQEALFQQITNFANTYELDIKVVGKMKEKDFQKK